MRERERERERERHREGHSVRVAIVECTCIYVYREGLIDVAALSLYAFLFCRQTFSLVDTIGLPLSY